jgi:hypothetical protein
MSVFKPFGLDKVINRVGETTSKFAENIRPGNIVGTVENSSIAIVSNVKQKLPAIVVGSLTLIAGLVWNDAFNAIINRYVPAEYRAASNAKVKFIYALVLTIVVIMVISFLV